jgi:hypothetical protein
MRAVLPVLVGFLWLAACSDPAAPPAGPDQPPDPDPPVDPVPDPDGELLCEVMGYACNAADISDAALERSQVLLVDLKQRVDAGASNDEAAAWIAAQEDVRHVGVAPSAVVFLVRGGVPFWLMTPDRTPAAPMREPALPAAPLGVVGHGTPRENAANRKKALVLSPFRFELGAADASSAVVDLLANVRDYQGGAASPGVDWRSNDTQPLLLGENTAGNVTVDDFLGWSAFDVIFLMTHGGVMEASLESPWCSSSIRVGCAAAVLTGERTFDCRAVIRDRYPTRVGLGCGGAAGAEGIFLTVSSDFFLQEYTGFNAPVEGAIVYFNACSSHRNGSFAFTLGGPRNAFFGWDNVVDPNLARTSTVRFFELLANDGLSTGPAYEKLKAEGRNVAGGVTLVQDTRGRPDGLHIREITMLKNPLEGGADEAPLGPGRFASLASAARAMFAPGDIELRDGDVLPFIGQAEDGENDEIYFFVDVEGVEAGAESDFSVRVEIDENEVGTWSLTGPNVQRIDDYKVRVQIQQPVDFDVQRGQVVKLKAITVLPEEGESPHEVNVVFRNPTLHFLSIFETTGGELTLTSEVEAEIEVAFKGSGTSGSPRLEVDVSEGPLEYVRFDVDVGNQPCTASTQTFDGRLQVAESDAPFDDPTSSDFGLPGELAVLVYPEIREILTLDCGGGSVSLDLIHWFAAFVSFHGGGFPNFPDELVDARGVFVLENWERGEGGVFARKVYQRTAQEDEVTLREDTRIELRGPVYRP